MWMGGVVRIPQCWSHVMWGSVPGVFLFLLGSVPGVFLGSVWAPCLVFFLLGSVHDVFENFSCFSSVRHVCVVCMLWCPLAVSGRTGGEW